MKSVLLVLGYFITTLGLSSPGLAGSKPAFLKPFAYSKPVGSYYLVYRNHYFGLLDSTGRQIVPCQYDDIDKFQEGMAEVVLKGKHGYINQRGKLVIPLRYVRANPFQHGEALVVTPTGDVGYLTKNGKPVYPFSQLGRPYFRGRYAKGWAWQPYIGGQVRESAGEFYQALEAPTDYVPQRIPSDQVFRPAGLTIIFSGDDKNRRYGLTDSLGHILFPMIFEDANEAEFGWKGWIRIKKNGRYGFLDRQSRQVVIPMVYEDSQPSALDIIWVKHNGTWGCINRKGKLVVPFQYSAVSAYSEHRAIVKRGNHFGYVDTTGKSTTPLLFDQASYYQNGQAKVYQGNQWLELDPQGRVLRNGLQGDVFWTWVKYGALLIGIVFFLYYVYRHNITLVK